jgi:hypothetical protein
VRQSPADPRTWLVRFHLLRCGSCRQRVKYADAELVGLFHAHVSDVAEFGQNFDESRSSLLQSIRSLESQRKQPREVWGLHLSHALISAGVLAALALTVFVLASRRKETVVTAASVLSNAAAREEASGRDVGVAFERVRLRDGNEQIEWQVYRDLQGQRTPHFQTASARESSLRQRLAEAGVARANPLSAASYRDWQSHLARHNDSVVFAPSGLITVKTSVSADAVGPVKEETLSVRESDYHPMTRTVTFRDEERVEIAELDYQVLNWKLVQDGWFESPMAAVQAPHILPRAVPHTAMMKLSSAELNLAELQARLVLSTENADTEQIDIRRTDDGVQVEGLASTSERKHRLQAALVTLPHVKAKLWTPEERAANEAEPDQPSRIKLIESVSQPSPLVLYLKKQHRETDAYRQISWKVLDSGLRISQQCHALRELQREFAPRMPLDEAARQTYDALWNDHVARLRSALTDQSNILQSLTPDGSAVSPLKNAVGEDPVTSIDDLNNHASRSLELSRELIAGEGENGRDALPILSELRNEGSALAAGLDRLRQQRP